MTIDTVWYKNVPTLDVTADDGSTSTVYASWVIACDGASSFVRQTTGLRLKDLGFDEPWMVVDVLVNDASLTKLRKTAAQYCNPARPTTFIVGPGNHRRWEIMLQEGENPREMETAENVWRLLSPWLDPEDGALWRASSYRFHALVAEQWRRERIFLAGDAAHQQPPFIGQGMCQGIRDVTNLCWKPNAVIRGGFPDQLLDTYEQERKLHVETLTGRIKVIGHHICERDPEAARKRDAMLLLQGGGKAPVVTRQEIVPPLQSGLLMEVAHKANGTLFPQPRIRASGGNLLLDEIAGLGWHLILDGRQVHQQPNQVANLTMIRIGGDAMEEADQVVERWFNINECVAALVRPDHYVFGVATEAANLPALIAEWRHIQRSE